MVGNTCINPNSQVIGESALKNGDSWSSLRLPGVEDLAVLVGGDVGVPQVEVLLLCPDPLLGQFFEFI